MIELNPKFHIVDFKNIDEKFTEMINDFKPINMNFFIEKYFGERLGLDNSIKDIFNDHRYIRDEENTKLIWKY